MDRLAGVQREKSGSATLARVYGLPRGLPAATSVLHEPFSTPPGMATRTTVSQLAESPSAVPTTTAGIVIPNFIGSLDSMTRSMSPYVAARNFVTLGVSARFSPS